MLVRRTQNFSGKLKHALKSRITLGDPSSLAMAEFISSDADVTAQTRGILKGVSPA